MIDSLNLCELNTWTSRRARNMSTYRHDAGQNQIDYIFTRRVRADRGARESSPTTLDLAPWRGCSKHMLVEATLPLHPGWRGPQRHTASLHNATYCKRSLGQAARDGSSKVDELRAEVSRRLAGSFAHSALDLNNILLGSCRQVFPKKPSPQSPKAWKQDDVQAHIGALWTIRSQLQRLRQDTCRLPRLQQLLMAWKKVLYKQKTFKELKAKGLQARRPLLHEPLGLAKQAAETHDQYGLFSVIRRLAPNLSARWFISGTRMGAC